MARHAIAPRTYVIVCVLLVLLTALTVGVSFIPLPGAWHLTFGLTIGLCKATLVVLFFMHVLLSNKVTWAVIVVVCFWVLILFGLTLTDYFTRDLVPFMPGH
jgi:cytochrome c oxidase subunit 4